MEVKKMYCSAFGCQNRKAWSSFE